MNTKCCKSCFWSYENNEYACGALKSSMTGWNLPCNAEKFYCFRWKPFVFKKHYCCDAEIGYPNEIEKREMEFYIRLYKRVYEKDLTAQEAVDIIKQSRRADNVEHVTIICAKSKTEYEKDLVRLKDKYGDRIVKITNYEKKVMKVAKEK